MNESWSNISTWRRQPHPGRRERVITHSCRREWSREREPAAHGCDSGSPALGQLARWSVACPWPWDHCGLAMPPVPRQGLPRWPSGAAMCGAGRRGVERRPSERNHCAHAAAEACVAGEYRWTGYGRGHARGVSVGSASAAMPGVITPLSMQVGLVAAAWVVAGAAAAFGAGATAGPGAGAAAGAGPATVKTRDPSLGSPSSPVTVCHTTVEVPGHRHVLARSWWYAAADQSSRDSWSRLTRPGLDCGRTCANAVAPGPMSSSAADPKATAAPRKTALRRRAPARVHPASPGCMRLASRTPAILIRNWDSRRYGCS
jgi:hypothetical protein